MEVRCTVDLHDVGLHELLRISIRRSERQNDALTGLNGTTVQFHPLFGNPGDGHRCIRPQQLLDRSTEQFRLGNQPRSILRVCGQVPETGSDGAPRRVRSSEQNQKTASQLMLPAQWLAVDVSCGQITDEAVTGRCSALREKGIAIAEELADAGSAHRLTTGATR